METSEVGECLSYDDISARVYGGEVLRFDGGGDALIQAARTLCREVFETKSIEKAHEQFTRREFLLRAGKAQEEFNTEPYKRRFADWLAHIGIDTGGDIYWDTLGLRIAAPVQSHSGGFRSHVGVHRDTWGSGIQAQINWWAPLMPLTYQRTLAFYPEYWQQPLQNTTATWSFKKYLAARRTVRAEGRAAAYPPAPKNTAEPVTPPHLVRPGCGQLLAFSAAHLHSSVTNCTDRTRYSLEIRTVRAQHIHDRHGAPNVDCESHPPLYQLFRALGDNTRKLSDMVPCG